MVRAVKKAKRPLKVLVLLHPELVPPDSLKGYSEKEIHVWKTEYDVVSTLRSRGHDVRALGLKDELKPIRDAIEGDWKPDVVFNLLEEFHGDVMYDQNVVSYLELLRLPYTGCNPRGLMLARGKALSKKLAAYHRIPVPDFTVFSIGRTVKRPPRLAFPLIVKSLSQDASLGIAQASLVDTDEKLAERVTFIHDSIGTDAIVEQYIDGREIYVGVLGSERLRVLPVWELEFGDLNASSNRIATTAVKHDLVYQERHKITQGPAAGLSPELTTRIQRLTKRICRALELDGYARIDFRLSADNVPYFIEANPNPEIARIEEFAQAALHAGIRYPALLERMLWLGIRRARAKLGE
jgi:D-alanine-D-alanine ligase